MFMSHIQRLAVLSDAASRVPTNVTPRAFLVNSRHKCRDLPQNGWKNWGSRIALASAAPVPPSCLHSLLLQVCEGLHGLPSQSWDRTWQPARWGFIFAYFSGYRYTITSPRSSAPLETTGSSICTPFCNMLELLPSLWSCRDSNGRPQWFMSLTFGSWITDHNEQQNTRCDRDVRDAENCNWDLSASPLPRRETLQGSAMRLLSMLQGLTPRFACFCILAKVLASSVSFLSEKRHA